MTHQRLHVTVSSRGPHALVVVEGTVDHGTEQTLGDSLRHAFDVTTTAVIIDLSAADLTDPANVAVVITAIRQATARTMTVVVCGLPSHPAPTGLDQMIYLRPDIDT